MNAVCQNLRRSAYRRRQYSDRISSFEYRRRSSLRMLHGGFDLPGPEAQALSHERTPVRRQHAVGPIKTEAVLAKASTDMKHRWRQYQPPQARPAKDRWRQCEVLQAWLAKALTAARPRDRQVRQSQEKIGRVEGTPWPVVHRRAEKREMTRPRGNATPDSRHNHQLEMTHHEKALKNTV